MIFEDEPEGREITEDDVNRSVGWMARNVEKLAQAIADRQHTDGYLKVVEAEQRALHAGEAAHIAEREARGSQQYKDALLAFRDASKQEQRMRYYWSLAETVIDVWRTRCANVRKV